MNASPVFRFAVVSLLASTMWRLPLRAQQPKAGGVADTIYLDGDIITGEELLSATPRRVSALAVRDDKVMAAGPDAQVLAFRRRNTEVIDLKGAFVMPGFNDAHVHLASAGRTKLTIDLIGVKSLTEMQQRIRLAEQTAPPGAWLRGRGWDHTFWPTAQLPARQNLDTITGNHPAVFTRVDGHIAVANSEALRLAGITATTADPPGGKIDRDSFGQPTGIVRETAVDLIYNKVPAPSHAERRQALELAIQDAIAHGITSVQDQIGRASCRERV